MIKWAAETIFMAPMYQKKVRLIKAGIINTMDIFHKILMDFIKGGYEIIWIEKKRLMN